MEYVELARAETDRGEVVLRERHDPDAGSRSSTVLELRVNGAFVMDTLETSSEKAMASAALEQVDRPRNVLIGGLGLGYTMHEVLADRRVERLLVIELEEDLVRWMRDGTVPHGPTYLADQRLTVIAADIATAVAEAKPGAYDLILLDVDNGPGFLVHENNAAIYQRDFLLQAQAVLSVDGALAIWSAAESPDLRTTMGDIFGNVSSTSYAVMLQTRTEAYWLYLARRH